MSTRFLTTLILTSAILAGCCREKVEPLDEPLDLVQFAQNLKGFSLQGKFIYPWMNEGYKEEEFIMIKDLGFNFVRLPIDYHTYTSPDDWNVFIDEEVAEIDQAVEWGRSYGIHVCLNLTRVPGYATNSNYELWTHEDAQQAFVNHWAFWSEHYKNIPNTELSFYLMGEPGGESEGTMVPVLKKAIDKIYDISPNRVIFVNGPSFASVLMMSLKGMPNVIQALHVYEPHSLTHYEAEWVPAAFAYPAPSWPMDDISWYLYGPAFNNLQSPLVLQGKFSAGTEVIVTVFQVENSANLEISLDDITIFSKHFLCTSDPDEDFTIILPTQWGYQNISGKNYSVILPSSGEKLAFSNTEGSWLIFSQITFKSDTGEFVIKSGLTTWGLSQDSYKITDNGKITYSNGDPMLPMGRLIKTLEMARGENIPVMITEFGVYNKTPHDLTIDYLTDLVDIFKQYNLGFAMWNFVGTMGIIDSNREDCDYEPYNGRLLDREMLAIMQ
ncbi:MAG TPA: cellulase family glycosylhydrolase [Cyclobacteriaceae bacterium]|nr:cellulase family glycosylhydrolase [Cyclobacteriaceae bacterium]